MTNGETMKGALLPEIMSYEAEGGIFTYMSGVRQDKRNEISAPPADSVSALNGMNLEAFPDWLD
jgi:hypothetical protein